jgi:hypothetical protein
MRKLGLQTKLTDHGLFVEMEVSCGLSTVKAYGVKKCSKEKKNL